MNSFDLLLSVFFSAAAGLIFVAVGKWSSWLPRKLIKLAAKRVPDDYQSRLYEEWMGEFEARPGNLRRLLWALDVLRGAIAINSEYKQKSIKLIGSKRWIIINSLITTAVVLSIGLGFIVLKKDWFSVFDFFIIVLPAIFFAWILKIFCTLITGYLLHLFGLRAIVRASQLDSATPMPRGRRTALAVPIHYDHPDVVARRLTAIYRSLEATGDVEAFDIFILSDSQDADVVFEEQTMWAVLCAELNAKERIFYRNRDDNAGRRAGNIAEFCRRWGKRYSYLICLGAGNLSGETIVNLVHLINANSKVGLIQTSRLPIGGNNFFSRFYQNVAVVFKPLFELGTAFWYPGKGIDWGQNAIIRTEAFMAHKEALLSELSHKSSFGGETLGYNIVDPALLARTGWSVWLMPDTSRSHEDVPQATSDYTQRDELKRKEAASF